MNMRAEQILDAMRALKINEKPFGLMSAEMQTLAEKTL